MPRAKSQASEPFVVEYPEGRQTPNVVPGTSDVVRDDAALLRMIGQMIRVRNQNGRRSDQFCLLCKEARRLKIPCPHAQIWADLTLLLANSK